MSIFIGRWNRKARELFFRKPRIERVVNRMLSLQIPASNRRSENTEEEQQVAGLFIRTNGDVYGLIKHDRFRNPRANKFSPDDFRIANLGCMKNSGDRDSASQSPYEMNVPSQL